VSAIAWTSDTAHVTELSMGRFLEVCVSGNPTAAAAPIDAAALRGAWAPDFPVAMDPRSRRENKVKAPAERRFHEGEDPRA
jgi:hypothetical protein